MDWTPQPASAPHFLISSLIALGAVVIACHDEEPFTLAHPAADAVLEPSADSGVAALDAGLGPDPEISPFGGRCTNDDDCPRGVSCVDSASNSILGGGPAQGYCSLECNIDEDCAEFDSTSICQAVGEEVFGYCFERCVPGSRGPGKCHDRFEVACLESFARNGTGSCYPSCRSHSDCGERFCDIGTGMCVDAPPAGLDIGAPCFPDASPSECSGICWDVDEQGVNGVCTGYCTLGDIGCNAVATADLGVSSACLLVPTSGGAQGDQGLCSQLCNCDDDCLHQDFKCVALPVDQAGTLGVQGVCRVAGEDTVGLACPSPGR